MNGALSFHQIIAASVGDPNICAVEEDFFWGRADWICAEQGTIAGSQLGEITTVGIANPNVDSVESNASRDTANCISPKNCAVAEPKFRHTIAILVCNPHAGSIKRDSVGMRPHGVISQ